MPIGLKYFFQFSFSKINSYFVIALSIWVLIQSIIAKKGTLQFNIADLGVLVLSCYSLLHFYLFSDANGYYYKLWNYFTFPVLFFMFRWVLNTSKAKIIIHCVLIGCVAISFFEAVLAILQYLELTPSRNNYFKLVGTFSSPNYLALYLGFGFVILIWYLLLGKIQQLGLKLLLILGLLFFGVVIIISKSRGTWLSIAASLLVMGFTSTYGKHILRKIDLKKGLLIILIGLVLSIFAAKFLYELKPDSVKGRFLAARISLSEIAKQPVKGHGLFSFAGVYNSAKATYFETEERPWSEVQHANYLFSPFNDYLLVGFELGLPVLFGVIALLFLIIYKTRLTNTSRIGLAIITVLSIWALFNAPTEKIQIMSIGLFGLALVVKHSKLKNIFKKTNLSTTIMKFILIIASVLTSYAANLKMTKIDAFNNYEFSKTENEIEHFFKLTRFKDMSYLNDMNIGRKLMNQGYDSIAIDYLEKAFKKTSAPRVGKRLAIYHLGQNNYKRIEEIYNFNINVEPYRYNARMDLLNFYDRLNRYDDLADLSKEIMDFPVKIPSKKIDIYKKKAKTKHESCSRILKRNPNLKGSLSVGKLFKSTILNKTLVYKIYLPPVENISKKLPVIYINDGFSYIHNGKMPQLIDSLIVSGKIKPVVAVFLNPIDTDTKKNIRQKLFLCNPKFVDFFTKEFMPKLENKYPISDKRDDRTILGLSFGGLAAAYIGHMAPTYFKNIAMQSPAFHPCPDIYKFYRKSPKKDFKIYLSYGTGKDTEKQDLPFIRILKKKEYNLKIERVEGADHNWELWKPQLKDILLYYYDNKS